MSHWTCSGFNVPHVLCIIIHALSCSQRNYRAVDVPKRKLPPFVSAFYATSRRVVLLASDATTVSRSKFYDVDTCSGEGDDVYFLSGLFPAFETLLWMPPAAGVCIEAYSMSSSRLQTSIPFQLFFFCSQNLHLGMRLDETKEMEVLALFMLALCVFDSHRGPQ